MPRSSIPRGHALPVSLLAALVVAAALVCTAVSTGLSGSESRTRTAVPPARSSAAPVSTGNWVGSWSASASVPEQNTPDGFPGMTIRNVVHAGTGGTAARVHLSNAHGDRPLTVSRATIGLSRGDGSPDAVPGTLARLTFGGRTSVTIAAGRTIVSDTARLIVPSGADLVVSTYSPTPSGPVTSHPYARQASYLADGEHTARPDGAPFTRESGSWRYLSAVDVWTTTATGTIVALGDSITDGLSSAADAAGNRRWTDVLAERLQATGDPDLRMGVLNQGISGNRLLTGHTGLPRSSGLDRLDRDVFSQTNVATLIVALGVNDILSSTPDTDPGTITSGLRQITDRAHARGIRVIGSTLLPFAGHPGSRPHREDFRQTVNAQIRAGAIFDAVIDFDEALRDPQRPDRMLPIYDCGDHLHPSAAGYRAMGTAVDLRILRGAAPQDL